MNKKSKVSKLLALACLAIMAIVFTPIHIAAFTAEKIVLPLSGETEEEKLIELWGKLSDFQESKLPTNYSSATLDLDEDKVEFYEDTKAILLKKPVGNDEYIANDLGTITFSNVAKIGNRSIDAVLSLDSIRLFEEGSGVVSTTDRVQIACFRDSDGGALWFGGYPLTGTPWEYIWGSQQSIQITTNVVYSDTGETVDFNFIRLVTDLDYNTKEGFETISGYTGKYYCYEGADWTEEVEGDHLKFTSGPTQNHTGLYEYYCGGVFLETDGGRFSTRTLTNCSGSTYQIFSQYTNDNDTFNPYKEIVPGQAEPYNVGDTVTFDVALTMFNWYDTFTRFSSMILYDDIPDGLDYVSAQVLDGDENDITATAGTLTEPSPANGNTVSFEFNSAWLNNDGNYNGKAVTLRIKAKVNGQVSGRITNTGYAKIDERIVPTNEVEIEVIVPDPDYDSLDPQKTVVDPQNNYKAGDTVTFDIAMAMDEWGVDIFTTYTSMEFYDQIPEGLTLVPDSGEIYKDDVKLNDADIGEFSYVGNKITFIFNDEYLAEESNYDGKTLTMRFDATVDSTDAAKTINNTGYVDVDGHEKETNEVEIEVTVPDPPVTTTTPPETTVTTPEVTTPEITTPEVTTPDVTTPDVTTPEITTPEVTTTTPGIETLETTTPAPGYGVIVSTASGTPHTSEIDLGAGVSDKADHQETTVYFVIASVLLAAGTAGAVSLRRRSKR